MAFDRTSQTVTVDDAIANIVGNGLASPSRFWVKFSLPDGLDVSSLGDSDAGVANIVKNSGPKDFESNLGKEIGFMCQQMTFPPRNFTVTEHRHVGTPFRVPISSQYTDVAYTFVCSSDLRERKYFEIWQQCVHNVHMNSFNFYREYVRPVHLMQLDKAGNVTYQVTLIDAYPVGIEGTTGSASSKDELQFCTVMMAYRHWINQELG